MIDRRALLALLAASGLARAEPAPGGTLVEASVDSRLLGEAIRFKVYLPAGYDRPAQRRYPVVWLLHGRGDRLTAWRHLLPRLDALIAAGALPPLIAVMPDAPWSRRGSYYVDSQHADGKPVETALLTELLPHVDATWRTDARREARVVGGYSMGGYGALRYQLAHPQLFGAALVLSPAVYTPLPPAGSSAREFGGFGRGAALFDDAIYQALNYPAMLARQARGQVLRVFIASGDDEYKNPDPAEALQDIDMQAHLLFSRLSRQPGCETELRIVDGGHDWPVWGPAFEEGLRWAAARLGWR